MIRGAVNVYREAMIELRVRGPAGTEVTVQAMLDTGFSSALTLPPATVASLGLPFVMRGPAMLGDGSVVNFDSYWGEIEWEGGWRPVLVSAVGERELAGMELFDGCELKITVVPGGAVEIVPLP
jgi:predicted aspartyl protease